MNHGAQTALLAALFYGGLLWVSVSLHRSPIERQLTRGGERALSELNGAGADLEVAFEGRDAVLTGSAIDRGQVAAAVQRVAELRGVRVVESRVEVSGGDEGGASDVAPDRQPAWFAFEASGAGGFELAGRVGSEEAASRLQGAVAGISGGQEGRAEGEIEVAEGVAPAVWIGAVESWLPEYGEFVQTDMGLAVVDGELVLGGGVYSEARRGEVLDAARRHFGGTGLAVVDELQLVPPPERPMLAIVSDGEGRIQLHGQLREPGLKQRLAEAVGNVGGGAQVDDQIAVGDHVAGTEWGSILLEVIPALVIEVADLQLAMSGQSLVVAGTVDSAARRSALAEMAEQAFADSGVSVDDQLVVEVPPELASLSIARSEDGVLRLAGMLADPSLGRAFIEAAEASCGPETELISAIGHGQNVAEALWVEEMANLVPAFVGAVRWGALSVHGDQVALEAEVEDPEAGDVLQRLVENAFPLAEYKRVIEVRVAAPEGPTDEEVMALEAAVSKNVIYFAPSAADLRPEGEAKLAVLASAFAKVPGASLAVLGVTGSAAADEALARRRCGVVREALEELGVEFLLMEIELRELPGGDVVAGRYESAHRVEFELR